MPYTNTFVTAPVEPGRFDRFTSVGSELLGQRKLLRRVDTKFLVSTGCLDGLLDILCPNYGILYAGKAAVARYETLYFDTGDLRCFHDHRRGRRPRHKIRVRHYVDRLVSFLEVKTKNNQNKTIKHRVQRRFGDNELTDTDRAFVASHCDVPSRQLRAQLWTNFGRITLVGLHTNERITMDVGLTFRRGDQERTIAGAMIVEVKQAPYRARTPVMLALRALGRRPASVSKYCAATGFARPDVRANRFLNTLKAVERLHG